MSTTYDATSRQVGLSFLRRFRRTAVLMCIAGLALFIGGFVGFGIFGNRNEALQRTGLHATAVITGIAPYPEYRFNEHIDIGFIDRSGKSHTAEIPIGETESYEVGQPVEVAYDRRNPSEVVLAHGYADIGAVGFPLIFAIIIGAVLMVIAVLQLRLARRARKILHHYPAQQMTATTSLARRGRTQVCLITLTGPHAASYQLRASSKRAWRPIPQPTQVSVFGDTSPRSVVVVVDSVLQRATAGRILRPPNSRRRSRFLR